MKRKSRSKVPTCTQLLRCIAAILEAPRDRYGRLEVHAMESSRNAREEMREYAVALKIGGCSDLLEQCAKVARAVIIEEGA